MADNLSKIVTCGHCSNISHMKIIGSVKDTQTDIDPGPHDECVTIYSVLECPACKKNNIIS